MHTEHALRYLLLKHLWRLRGTTGERLHAEIARSLVVDRLDGVLRLSWMRDGVAHSTERAERDFDFYGRGDVPRREETEAIDNDAAARSLAGELLGVSLPPLAPPQPLSLYLDTWRWPLLCALAGAAGVFISAGVLPVVFAATAIAESRWRSYWLYVPLAATLALVGFRISAVALGAALAAVAALASTDARGRLSALGYLLPALIGWQMPAAGRVDVAGTSFALTAFAASVIWVVLWLSYEGPRVTILLTPPLVVTLLADRQRELAFAYLVSCLIYAVWLSPLARVRAH